MISLEESIYTSLYKKYITDINDRINIRELTIFLEYNIRHHNYLITYLINDIIRKLHELNQIRYFFKFYNYAIKCINKP